MEKQKNDFNLPDDPLWYKDAIIYQLHIKAFYDHNGDGIGDFRGLAEKIDYLEKLGVTAVWLLPFYPSPQKDDGYDISDYTTIHPSYGSLQDFTTFLKEAHKRGIRVITELVINHTSDQHPWFQRARRAPAGSIERNFYVWSDTTEKYRGTRIIFKDFEPSNWSKDNVANAYYWHRFYSHQPDLNFDSPHVRKEISQLMDLWMKRGVDGMRLDAIPYLFEREGTSCENLPETHTYLKELRKSVDSKFKNRMFLAEANQWPEDAVAYFGKGDECQMAFHFPLMPRLFMSLRMEDRYPIIEIMNQTPPIPENCQWATFLRNHDELTLEMVTDRERDYMYKVYAKDREARINLGIRRRLAPLLGNSRRAIELITSLYFSLPGTPIIYYGDEIGMGDNYYLGDRNGVRTPMQWSPDRNAGFSKANPQRLYMPVIIDPEYHYEALNVESQEQNPRSFLWWMRRLVALRKQHKAFGRGTLEFLSPDNPKILAYFRSYQEEKILVVANLSRFSQGVELDLSSHKGFAPVEMFGKTKFRSIGEEPYFMTLGPHSFFWFSLEPQKVEVTPLAKEPQAELPIIRVSGSWEKVFDERNRGHLQKLLPVYIQNQRWFGGKARTIQTIKIADVIKLSHSTHLSMLVFIEVGYTDGSLEMYSLPLSFSSGEKAHNIKIQNPSVIFVAVEVPGKEEGILYDPMWGEEFPKVLLDNLQKRRRIPGKKGEIVFSSTKTLPKISSSAFAGLKVVTSRAEQSNTSVFYGDKLVLKMIRRLETGLNPDLEIGRYLTENGAFSHMPPVLGGMEYRQPNGEFTILGTFQGFIANEGDSWKYTLEHLGQYYERALAREGGKEGLTIIEKHFLDSLDDDPPDLVRDLFGHYLEQAALLGKRTGEFHLAIGAETSDPEFFPEAFTGFFQQSQYQGMRGHALQVFQLLKKQLKKLDEGSKKEADRILANEQEIIKKFRSLKDGTFQSMRIRTHGDFHLGQVLFTGKDFILIDFEGEPARSLGERRQKTSPLRDVAGMLRSFHYASNVAAHVQTEKVVSAKAGELEPWRKLWFQWIRIAFVKSYLLTTKGAAFVPQNKEELKMLLDIFILDKSIYELGYELNNRPTWVRIPIQGILEIIEKPVTLKISKVDPPTSQEFEKQTV
ncbi:maltose alpha-D-glucosyltransferase [bacterium F11]|nr:maltose alpha-D-glucosyltransferase [bacterium F11]